MKRIKLLALQNLLRLLLWVYHVYMKTITAPNGREIAIFTTPSGVTGYIDTSIPMEAIQGLRAKLEAKLGIVPGSSQPSPTDQIQPDR
ncbi:MAG TPA: hypothetical protein VIE65_01585 [Methylobacter sp.]